MAQAQRLASPNTKQEVLPASQYLQDRLQERRERNTRPRRSRQSDFGPQTRSGRDDDIFIEEGDKPRRNESSPYTPGSRYATPTDSARRLGAKQLDEQVDRLTKENFSLKLEIDHRRAREQQLKAEIESMRAIVRRAEALEEEHTELMSINVQLVEELEKRDKAIVEATDIILEFEDKIKEYEDRMKELEDDSHSVKASTIQADSGYAGTETHEAAPAASPAILQKSPSKAVTPAATSASRDLNEVLNSPKRRPQFLSQEKPSTQALRKVYLENAKQLHPVKSFQSILSRHTSIDEELHSPNLSDLSQSFRYSPKKPSPDRHPWEPEDFKTPASTGHTRQASISRVSQWIEGHKIVLDNTPSKSSNLSLRPQAADSVRTISPAPTAVPIEQYQPLHNALKDPLFDPLELLRPDLPRSHTAHPDSRRSSRTPTSFGGPIFGEPLLAPDPDTASQRLLRSSRSTIVGEKSITDNAPMFPKAFEAFDTSLRTAPKQMRSSVELNTAFVNNQEYLKSGLRNVYHAERSPTSPSDDESNIAVSGFRWPGYPDGNSIINGTPSRFLKHNKPPAGDMFFDGNDLSSPEAARRRRRRKSSAEPVPKKPELTRAGTSPVLQLTLKTDVKNARGEVTSPISYQSGSSSRTALADSRRAMSPDALSPRAPPSRGADRVSASPVRTLTQKTQQLFRRLSSSHGSDRTPEPAATPRPTLPTLTSTPSSAYVNVVPKDLRRQHGMQNSIDSKIQAPPTPSRTRTLSDARGTLPTEGAERRGLFGRRGSFKTGLERSKTAIPMTSTRGRRRSSVKDNAVPRLRLYV